jgi:hypothetical protein
VETGDAGDDQLWGDDGDDDLDGGVGRNSCDGGAGTNNLHLSCDSQPPTITSLSFSPDSIDTSNASQIVTAHFTVHDNLAGMDVNPSGYISPIHFRFIRVGGSSSTEFSSQGPKLVAGDALDGTYETTFTIPVFTQPGTWEATDAVLADRVDNSIDQSLDSVGPTGGYASFSQTAPGDSAPPVVAGITMQTTTVDTSAGSATVSALVHVTDAGVAGLRCVPSATGGEQCGDVSITFRGPDGGQWLTLDARPTDRVSGDAADGTYLASATLPRHAEQGAWQVSTIDASDAAYNAVDVRGSDLGSLAGLTFQQTGAGDDTPPVVVSMSADPTVVHTATHDESITITAHVTDDLAGSDTQVGGICLGGQYGQTQCTGLVRTSGDALDGIYTSTVLLPQYSAFGTWQTVQLQLRDLVGNIINPSVGDTAAFQAANGFITIDNEPG